MEDYISPEERLFDASRLELVANVAYTIITFIVFFYILIEITN